MSWSADSGYPWVVSQDLTPKPFGLLEPGSGKSQVFFEDPQKKLPIGISQAILVE